jgi:radical SAM family RiPP maturation amino acid epimerase
MMSDATIVPAFRHPEQAAAEYLKELANTKRLLELWELDDRFRDRMRQDPAGAAAEHGLEVDPEEVRLLWDPEARRARRKVYDEGRPVPDLPRPVQRHAAFVREKLVYAEEWLANSDPADPAMTAWRNRQIERSCSQLGSFKGRSLVHVPVAIELAVGCSVGCWFCSVAAPSLSRKAVYAEVKGLWQEVLQAIHEVVGAAARWGFCYWATDPLDNPDYAEFCCDFAEVFGRFPQTTTAIAWKDPERTRSLLKLSREKGCELNRFSILTLSILRKIHAAFRPEELLQVELLPLNKEAGRPKAFSGRAREGKPPSGHTTLDPELASTTSCVTGFLLNLVERSVRLITPCSASDRWPLGHWVVDQAVFRDGDDLSRHMRRMIAEHMPTYVKPERQVRLRGDLAWTPGGDGEAPRISSRFIHHDVTHLPGLEAVAWQVAHRPGSAADLALALEDEKGIPLANTMYLLSQLQRRGLLDEEPPL